VIRHSVGSEPWRIGVLFSRTGVTAVIEQSQLQGTLLALEEVNSAGGINGRELVPVIYDPGSDPAKFARYAHKLLTEDRVTMIFGCYTSTSRKAVLPLVERWNGLLWYPTLYEGFEYSPNIIYTRSRAQPEQPAPGRVSDGAVWQSFLFRWLGLRLSPRIQPHHARVHFRPQGHNRGRAVHRPARGPRAVQERHPRGRARPAGHRVLDRGR
jgi:Periplasmic binding protein domain